MASTLRNDTRRALTLERIAKAWDKRADLSLGELFAAALDDAAIGLMTDTEIVEAIERYVLLGGEAPPSPPGGP